jgi:hypothetical protein
LRDHRHPAEIGDDPEAVNGQVKVDEGQAAAEAGDGLGDLVLQRGRCGLGAAPLLKRLDVSG